MEKIGWVVWPSEVPGWIEGGEARGEDEEGSVASRIGRGLGYSITHPRGLGRVPK